MEKLKGNTLQQGVALSAVIKMGILSKEWGEANPLNYEYSACTHYSNLF